MPLSFQDVCNEDLGENIFVKRFQHGTRIFEIQRAKMKRHGHVQDFRPAPTRTSFSAIKEGGGIAGCRTPVMRDLRAVLQNCQGRQHAQGHNIERGNQKATDKDAGLQGGDA